MHGKRAGKSDMLEKENEGFDSLEAGTKERFK